MAEENKNNEEYLDDGTKNPNYVAPKDDAGEKNDKDDIEKKDDKEEGEKDIFDDTINPEKPPEIPIRKYNAQQIIARKNEQIKKLKSKTDKTGDEEDIEDNDIEEKEEKISVQDEIKRNLAPILDVLTSQADTEEINSLIKDEPEAKNYANHIKAYMSHDLYKGVPASVIYHHLAWKKAQAIGAKKKNIADVEANQNKGGGRNIPLDTSKNGDFPSPEDIANMSEAEFEKMQNDALQK